MRTASSECRLSWHQTAATRSWRATRCPGTPTRPAGAPRRTPRVPLTAWAQTIRGSWHGAAWEFNRDDSLQARNYFASPNQPKPKLRQNQFGGAAGGPLVRDRLFAFGYYEGYRNTSGVTQNFVVLSEAQRTGNFGVCPQRLVDLSEALRAGRAQIVDQRAQTLQLGLHAAGHRGGRRTELLVRFGRPS